MTNFDGSYANQKVLVTGHTGFKGSWLTAWLHKMGAQVCGYSDQIPTTPALFEDTGLSRLIRDERGDIRDREKLAKVVNDFRPSFLFHLAAQPIVSTSYAQPLETFSVNAMGTATVLDVVRDIDWPCTVIVITSDKAYENVEWPWGYRETDSLGGKDIYSGSKGAAELVYHSYFHSFLAAKDNIRSATARAGNVIGGGDWAADRIVADCIRAWRRGDIVQIRSPNATRPWQHVLEPLSGYLALGQALANRPELDGESYNFGPRAEQNATVLQMLHDLSEVWGFEDPSKSYEVTGNIPFYESSLLKLNIDKALLELKWQPNLSYDECMRMTGEWYRDVIKSGQDPYAITLDHITRFETLASARSASRTR